MHVHARAKQPCTKMLWRSDSYNADAVEELLRKGELKQALNRGWFGDEWSYRLVRAATVPKVTVSIASSSSDALGLDLRNEDGVATVGQILSGGAVAADGQLRSGDVIRSVNGSAYYTCEAVVKAIKAGKGSKLTLEAVRPPVLHTWRDEITLAPSGHLRLEAFETYSPACLTYWWREATSQNVGLSVVRLDGSGKARRGNCEAQTSILDLQSGSGRGHVMLLESGRYMIMWDNRDSFWRKRTVRYLLRCVPLDAWEAGRQVERLAHLELECEERKVKGKALVGKLQGAEEKLRRLQKEVFEQEAFVSQVRKEKLDNNAAWLAAKAEKEELSARRDREQRNSRESMNGGGAPSAASPPSAATALSPATLTTAAFATGAVS